MKIKTLLVASFVSVSSLSFASSKIEFESTSKHITPYKYMELEVHRANQVLGRFMKDEFGCAKTKLCLTDYVAHVTRIFKTIPGTFTLNLTATCKDIPKDFKFNLGAATDWEDYSDVLVKYSKNGKTVMKDILTRKSGEDFNRASNYNYNNNCDTSPVDAQIPYKIITNPDYIRPFPES